MKKNVKKNTLIGILSCLLSSSTMAASHPPAHHLVSQDHDHHDHLSTLAWKPSLADTWEWQLHGTLKTSYPGTVYDIDLFDTSQENIQLLKDKGKKVVCYFSAGSSEDWRTDFKKFKPADMEARWITGQESVGWIRALPT